MFFKKDELSKFEFISFIDFILALFLMFCALVLTAIVQLIGKNFSKQVPFLNTHFFDLTLFIIVVIQILFVIYWISCIRRKKSLREGLFLANVSRKTILLSILVGVLMPLLTLPLMFQFAPKHFYAMDLAKHKDGLIFIIISAGIAPLFEEVFYRGFFFTFIQSKLNSIWAITLTSLLFGVSHISNLGDAVVLVFIFIFYGLVLSLARYFSKSLIPPLITHFFHNATLISVFFIYNFVNSFK